METRCTRPASLGWTSLESERCSTCLKRYNTAESWRRNFVTLRVKMAVHLEIPLALKRRCRSDRGLMKPRERRLTRARQLPHASMLEQPERGANPARLITGDDAAHAR
jgi:hypothetical protein